MNTTRRSFSFGQNNRIHNKPKALHISLPRQHSNSVTTPKIHSARACENNIFRYQKSQAIKQIINDYFKEEFEGQKNHIPVHLPRRIHRIRPREAATIREPLKLGEDLGTSSIAVQPALSKTSYVLSWQRQKDSHLPPIHEQGQQPENLELRQTFFSGSYTQSFLLRSSSGFSESFNPQTFGPEETFIPTFQNEIFKVMIVMKAEKPVARLKEFKESGLSVLERQIKIKSFGLPRVWKESNRNPFTYETGMQSPLKYQLCKIFRDDINPKNIRIRPKALYKRIAADGFQELRSLLRSFCQDLKKIEGKVINNKVNPDNIFLTKEYKLCLAQWGYSSFRDSFDIRSNSFESRLTPVLKGTKNWYVSPEYLAPEVIDQLLGQFGQDIWTSASSPDIWSLGLFTYELMTLVPIWCSTRCVIITKPEEFSTIKSGQKTGIMGTSGRDLRKIQDRHKIIQNLIRKEMESWSEDVRQLGHLILKMVEPRRDLRITLDELIVAL